MGGGHIEHGLNRRRAKIALGADQQRTDVELICEKVSRLGEELPLYVKQARYPVALCGEGAQANVRTCEGGNRACGRSLVCAQPADLLRLERHPCEPDGLILSAHTHIQLRVG